MTLSTLAPSISHGATIWLDALDVGQMLEELIGNSIARTIFESYSTKDIVDFHKRYQESISQFLSMHSTEKRHWFHNVFVSQSQADQAMFLTLVIICLLRARSIACISEEERFHNQLRDDFEFYFFPFEVFAEIDAELDVLEEAC